MLSKLHELDINILTQVRKLPKGIRPVMIASTIVGQPVVLLALIAIFAGYMYVLKEYTLVRVSMAASLLLLVSPIFKIVFQRARPDELLYASYKQPSSYSFPSGHAYCSILILGLFAYLAYTRIDSPYQLLVPIVLAVLIFVIGFSRVYLGSHYASDVFAGWLLGSIVLVLLIKISGI